MYSNTMCASDCTKCMHLHWTWRMWDWTACNNYSGPTLWCRCNPLIFWLIKVTADLQYTMLGRKIYCIQFILS